MISLCNLKGAVVKIMERVRDFLKGRFTPDLIGREINYDGDKILGEWEKLRRSALREGASEYEVEITETRINSALNRFLGSSKEGESEGGKFAFLIQPRDWEESNFGDIGDYLPALKYVEPQEKYEFFLGLPPFEVVPYRLDGQRFGSVICVPLSVDVLAQIEKRGGNSTSRMRKVAEYALPIIGQAVRFARDRLGVKYLGLGEMMAKMTGYGKEIEKEFEGVEITTGHAGTTWLIEQTLLRAAELGGIDLRSQSVGIIGCGSIGTAAAVRLAEGNVNSFVLFDLNPSSVSRLKGQLEGLGKSVEIADSAGGVCGETKIIISAVSSISPVLKRNNIRPGTIIVDDSQPPTVLREEAEAAGGVVVWPLAKMPERIRREGNYNFGPNGVLPGSAWGCEMEITTLAFLKRMHSNRVNHRVEPDEVDLIGRLAREAGFTVDGRLQSFGRIVDANTWEKIRRENS
jgi:predicted amino acid dehydrogenase